MINVRRLASLSSADKAATEGFVRGVSAIALLTSLLCSGTALAQEQDEGTQTENQSSPNEILVTAQRREERLQDVPISIAALTNEAAEASAVKDLNDVAAYVPGFSAPSTPGFRTAGYRIRGIGSNFLTVDGSSAVSVFLDDVYLGRPVVANMPLVDMARVEVVKGPQGTLFGRNTIGGAVSLVTNRPTGNLEGFVRGTVEDYGRWRVEGASNLPLAETISARIAGQITSDPGQYRNAATGGNAGGDSNESVRLALLFEPSLTTTFLLTGDLEHMATDGPAVKNRVPLPGNDYRDPYGDVDYDAAQRFVTNGRGLTLRGEFDLDSISAISITNYRHDDVDFLAEVDATPLNMLNQYFTQDFEQFYQEFRLTSANDSPLEWLLAGSYFWEKSDEEGNAIFGGDILRVLGLDVPSEITSTQTRFNSQKIESYAVFGELRYEIVENLTLTAGLRYTHDHLIQTIDTNSLTPPFSLAFGAGIFGPTNGPVTRTESFEGLTPRFVVDYKPSSDLMFYGSVTNGYKMGGFDPSRPTEGSYKPERVWNYEVGMRSSWLDNRLRVNLTGFYYKYSNLLSRNTVNGVLFLLDSKVKGKGFEAEVIANPYAGLDIGTSLSYQDPEFEDFVQSGVQLAGNSVPGSSKFAINTFADYSFPVSSGGDVALRVEYNHTGKAFSLPNNNPNYTIFGAGLTNFRISYSGNDGQYSFGVFGRNIFNVKYLATSGALLPGLIETWSPGPEASFGLEFKVNY